MSIKQRLLILSALILLAGVFFFSCQTTPPEPKPSEQVASDFIRRYPDPDAIHWFDNDNHFSWQAGYVLFAMEKMWHWTGDSLYFNYLKRYAEQNVDAAGNVPVFRPTALDNFLPGYTLIFMYEATGEEKYRIAAETVRDGFRDYPRTSNGLFWHTMSDWGTDQVWVDGAFMGQVFLARYGKSIGDSEYAFGEVVNQMLRMAEVTRKENGLFLHAWDESKKARWADPVTGRSPEVWSEGMGWYAVLIADVFDYLPASQPGREQLLDMLKTMCAGLKATQDAETGLWCQVVDKPDAPGNWNETSGSGMFLYLLQQSVNNGYISKEEYAPIIEKAYQGLLTKKVVNEQGFIDLIDCSSIGVKSSYEEYISQPHEVSPFAAFGSYLIGTGIYDFGRK